MKPTLPVYVLTTLLLATVGEAAAAEGEYLLYVGSYTDAPSNSKGIYAWRFEPSSGKLTSLGLVAETVNPAYVCATADGRFLYAVNWQTPEAAKGDTVSAYSINKNTGALTFLNKASAGGGLPNQVIVDPQTKLVMVTNYGFHSNDAEHNNSSLAALPKPFPVSNRNLAPRLGIAWQPGGRSGWVFRAGAGLFYDRYPLEFLNYGFEKNGRQGLEQYLTGANAQLAFTLARGGTLVQPLSSYPEQTFTAVAPFPSTYSSKVVLGAERRINKDTTATVEYSDVHGLYLPRIRSNYPNGYWLEQSASSTYQGVSLTVNRRFSNEVAYLASYNYSVTHDDASDYDEQPLDPRNTRLDWALSRQHQPHRVSVSGVFDLFESGWFKNITLAPVFTWGSGRPLNTLLTTDVYRTGAYPISARPEGFPRNAASMPRTVALDARVMKTIKVKHGRAVLQFGVEAFNLMNHTNRLRVSPYYTTSFGGLIEAQNPRQVRLMSQFEY